MQPSLDVRRCKWGLSAHQLQLTVHRIRLLLPIHCPKPLSSPRIRHLSKETAFLLLKARFVEVKQDLETAEHGIADGAAISQID
jgi:hypothetical protein